MSKHIHQACRKGGPHQAHFPGNRWTAEWHCAAGVESASQRVSPAGPQNSWLTSPADPPPAHKTASCQQDRLQYQIPLLLQNLPNKSPSCHQVYLCELCKQPTLACADDLYLYLYLYIVYIFVAQHLQPVLPVSTSVSVGKPIYRWWGQKNSAFQ